MTIYEQLEENIINRMLTTNDYLVGINSRYYWANENHTGCLIEVVSSEELACVHGLLIKGDNRIVHEVKYNNI